MIGKKDIEEKRRRKSIKKIRGRNVVERKNGT